MMKTTTFSHLRTLLFDLIKRCIGSSMKGCNLAMLLLLLLCTSCYTTKQVNYLQSERHKLTIPLNSSAYKVQPNDVLNVKVQSRDNEQMAYFNLNADENRNSQPNPASLFLSGHPVNMEGKINLAIVGELKVSELTVEEIQKMIQTEMDKYLLNAIVTVKLTSFKISVLGDVKNPGTNYVFNTQSTLFEALSAAGDLNLSGKRKDVKLIRQIGDETIVINLDLTDPSIIQSPYYLLHPNDVIYVETSKQNILRNNLGLFSVVLSAISTTVLVLNFISTN